MYSLVSKPQLWLTRPVARAGFCTALLVAVVVDLTGCSTLPAQNAALQPVEEPATSAPNPDPWEAFNRHVTDFNDKVDAVFAKPLSEAYIEVTPDLVRTGVSNFFFNLSSLPSAINNLLQGNLRYSAEGVMRVGVNTVFGLGGVFDLASDMKIDRHKADFGQTLGKWGVPTGPYLVIPLMGPTTLRDTVANVALPRDEVLRHVRRDSVRYQLYLLRAIEQRANLLRATGVMEEAALDKYTFTRDVFLQVRSNQVDGDPLEVQDDQKDRPDAPN
jgi:phospholipid-binding lipoprotein MlaA